MHFSIRRTHDNYEELTKSYVNGKRKSFYLGTDDWRSLWKRIEVVSFEIMMRPCVSLNLIHNIRRVDLLTDKQNINGYANAVIDCG